MTHGELTALLDGLTPVLRDFNAAVVARLEAIDLKAKGLDGERGLEGPAGRPGRDGRDGRDGQSVPGLPGLDGKDGLSPEDFDWTFDAETGNVTIMLSRDGVVVKSVTKPLDGFVRDFGVYKEGVLYPKGAGVTWAGSFWIAQEATSTKPGLSDPASRAWRLAVKAGREGREGKIGPEGKPGPRGEKGEAGPKQW